MTAATIDRAPSCAIAVRISDDALGVSLADGREISVPLGWFPRLQHATPGERRAWRLLDYGRGIRWDAIDEDISVAGLLAGRPAGESPASFARWRAARGVPGAERGGAG